VKLFLLTVVVAECGQATVHEWHDRRCIREANRSVVVATGRRGVGAARKEEEEKEEGVSHASLIAAVDRDARLKVA